jgi:hypothetical protein
MEYRRIQNETKEEQEALWSGKLGEDYNIRNERSNGQFLEIRGRYGSIGRTTNGRGGLNGLPPNTE